MTKPIAIMIFAAGFGTRMRPLSNDRPKPMVELNNRPMIDYALDHAHDAGAETIAVNLHYKAEVLERHLAGTNVQTIPEDAQILDTGGGLRNALPVLGADPVWTLNPDAIWRGPNPLEFVARHWDPEKMDALLLCVDPANAIGSDSHGDFSIDTAGHLTRAKGSIFGGAQIVKTDRLTDFPEASFSLNKLWDVLISEKHALAVFIPANGVTLDTQQEFRKQRLCCPMFEENGPNARVFGQPLGTDFPLSVATGLLERMADQPPEALSRVHLIVNTTRMRRRIEDILTSGPSGFLPKILLLSNLEPLLTSPPPEPPRHKLERRLQLAQLIAPAVKDRPELAAQSSVFALADSLATLMDEMQGEGVSPDAIENLDVSDQSGHWQNAKSLISIAHTYVSAIGGGNDNEARQRIIVQNLIRQWADCPPTDPIIVAGSTGSRGTTSLLMEAVAKLPMGAVIFPGFDTHMPDSVWRGLSDTMTGEDHPQFRFATMLATLGLNPSDIPAWTDTPPCAAHRNAVVSLALRPAPVTDAWLTEGAKLPNLNQALTGVNLIEAPTQRAEALAIAMRLRQAAQDGQKAALITPDRMLGRQVAAALDRWDIIPDDSGGAPLHLSAPGRFLRHTADLFLKPLDAEQLLILLKHPLTASTNAFPDHGLYTQRLEMQLRRDRVPTPDADKLAKLVENAAGNRDDKQSMMLWGQWICRAFLPTIIKDMRPLRDWLADHRAVSELISSAGSDDPGELWKKAAGREALIAFEDLEQNAEFAGDLNASDYAQLLASILSQGEVRDRDKPHPNIMIWGTLEARVQGADLVILGGLNDGVWPEAVTADPWLNRSMRRDAGLLLPDRRVGLSAHDFQQAIAAPEVWLTRAVRSDDAETVPSRWANRLMNLVGGLSDRDGPLALSEMRARGQVWLDRASKLEDIIRVSPAKRAAPVPPVSARPRDFSVTEIKTLIRDPYAIYARHCLGLREIDALVQEPDALIRGTVIHDIMESFVHSVAQDPTALNTDNLMAIADTILQDQVQWPTTRIMWRARLERAAAWIVETEKTRSARGQPAAMERTAQGKLALPLIGGSIRARADRIDVNDQGQALLYDYKSGTPPKSAEQKAFDKQLPIEAAMIEEGAFDTLGPREVLDAVYIGLGSKPEEVAAPLEDTTSGETLADLQALIGYYLQPTQHFTSRRMLQLQRHYGDYDHLARHGEWDDTDLPEPEDLS